MQRSTIYGNAFTRRGFSPSIVLPGLQARLSIADRLEHDVDAEDVVVQGWVRSVRKQKRVAFAAISDGSTTESLQAVLKPEDAAEYVAAKTRQNRKTNKIHRLSNGTAVELKGDWKGSTGSKQSHELQVSTVDILGENDAESNPLQPKYQTPEYLRSIPHLRARIPSNALLLRLRSQLITSLSRFFYWAEFVQTHTPIITSSDCEGAGEVFTVSSSTPKPSDETTKPDNQAQGQPFFRTPKYLTVSAQLHLEALAQAVNRVWTLSPTFRAEQSDTARHLSEFYMLEAEMCFVRDLNEVMDVVEDMLRSVALELKDSPILSELLRLKQAAGKEDVESSQGFVSAETVQQRLDGLAAGQWPRITYAHAIDVLQDAHSTKKAMFTFEPSYEDGLQAEHERYIASSIGQGKPVFVTDYPRAQKPFYMPPSTSTMNSSGSADTVACFDLLVPDLCELVGGSVREHRSKELLEAMQAKCVAGDNLDWYQDLRKYGSVPHGGFGLGFDRLLCYLAGVANVRDVVAFPRWYGRCDC